MELFFYIAFWLGIGIAVVISLHAVFFIGRTHPQIKGKQAEIVPILSFVPIAFPTLLFDTFHVDGYVCGTILIIGFYVIYLPLYFLWLRSFPKSASVSTDPPAPLRKKDEDIDRARW